ncbi:MAG: tRNA pseudouridine(55) synthase TruB [Bradymonadia bacterium]
MTTTPKHHATPGFDGLLLIDKPAGMTSFDVVARVRRALRIKRVGHTGTLDPLATGLMGVLVGRATRLSPYITAADKRYEARFRLGVVSDTYDRQGEISTHAPEERVNKISQGDIAASLSLFRGCIDQVPPVYSAIKVKGERAYARARRGEHVELSARQVNVHALDVEAFAAGEGTLSIHCSKGTYVRSLVHDMGQALGTGAIMTELRRTAVGQWQIAESTPLDTFCELTEAGRTLPLISMWRALDDLPALTLTAHQTRLIRHGNRFALEATPAGRYRVADESRSLLAIVAVDAEGLVRVERGVPSK